MQIDVLKTHIDIYYMFIVVVFSSGFIAGAFLGCMFWLFIFRGVK